MIGQTFEIVDSSIQEVQVGLYIGLAVGIAFLGLVVGIAFLVVFYVYWQKKREAKLRRVALEMGFSFVPDADALKAAGFSRLPPFFPCPGGFFRAITRRTFVSDIFKGTVDGTEVILCRYMRHAVRTTPGVSQTIASFSVSETALPDFKLESGKSSPRNHIEFPSTAEFSKSYRLEASDENAVRDLFDQRTLQFFAREKGWTVESKEGWLMVYRYDRDVESAQLRGFVDETKRILRLFVKK